MIKLIDLLKEVQEGAKVTFDDKGTATDIEIAYKPLDGEQLQTYDGAIKKSHYTVYYSLKSSDKGERIKSSEDALKHDSGKIKPEQLKDLLSKTIRTRLPKVDYIASLESEDALNKVLVNSLQGIYSVPDENIVDISKVEYVNIDDAVDWDFYNRQTEKFKKAISHILQKTAEKPGPYKLSKSGGMQGSTLKAMHSKYDLGLNAKKGQPLPPVYNALVECITKGKTMIIVDDNMHSGTDFYKIFQNVEKLVERLREELAKPLASEQEALDQIEKVKEHPKFKTSQVLQDRVKKFEVDIKSYRERTVLTTSPLKGTTNRIFGYVLYLLQDKDLKR